MTDLRTNETVDERLTKRGVEGLAEYVSGMVQRWEEKRDVEYRRKWLEYRRLWMGEWAAQDRDRQAERSHAIMPAIQQAVDSAVSEVEEAIFGQARWFDVVSDDPATQEDEGGPGRRLADQLLVDLDAYKAAISEVALNAAIYGTGIGKIIVHEGPGETIRLELVAVEPFELAIEPASRTILEAEGVAHVFHLPYNVVLERQRAGIYEDVDPQLGVEPGDERHADVMDVHIIEYQGLVPASMLPSVDDGRDKLPFEDEKPVEAIVTLANRETVLRATPNPLPGRDRSLISFQWDTVPNRFWGRGIVEKGYWPQKVLDSEVRARIDSLGFATMPMMAINAAMVPRGAKFDMRPGRNVFFNGNPGEAMAPFQFPPPDPQTYTQGQEMQRMIEMATGQLQAATPFGTNGRNETASGMSMMLGASIRRTRRTMANIERHFMRPLLRKSVRRLAEFDSRYPDAMPDVRMSATLGMMAREFEAMQLGQLINAMPPGPAQFMLLRAVVDNMGLKDRQNILELLDLLTAQAMEPPQPEPDLSGQARILGVQLREKELEQDRALSQARLLLDQRQLEIDGADKARAHEREVMRIAVDAEETESKVVSHEASAVLDLAKAQSEDVKRRVDGLIAAVKAIKIEAPTPANGTAAPSVDMDALKAEILAELSSSAQQSPAPEDLEPLSIERDGEGLITSVNGRAVTRDDRGLIVGVQ